MPETPDVIDDRPITGDGLVPPGTDAGFVPFPAIPGLVATNEQVDALRELTGV